jgi:hypothetical protein
MPENLQPRSGAATLETHESSHDTFDNDKHKNWLAHQAGLGIYVHGRVHQQSGVTILVGDLVHKRGFLVTDDVLKMEEQVTLSHGEPLSVSSRMGALRALEVLPTMNTANGEGDLIAYYDRGVVAFDTFQFPRETRYNGDGEIIQQGWDSKRLVNHLLNTVSAVGPHAVAALPRDHVFRSFRGIHFLTLTLGVESLRSENVNMISMDVSPLLDEDAPELLHGAAAGFWSFGDRVLCTTGLIDSETSGSPLGKGMVVWNQAATYTENRSPRPVWEGLWTLDYGIEGIHSFVETAVKPQLASFGFVATSKDSEVLVGRFVRGLQNDIREGYPIPIQWAFDTAQVAPEGLTGTVTIKDVHIEGIFSDPSQKVRVFIRTDRSHEWTLWREVSPLDGIAAGLVRASFSVGAPPAEHRTATLVQVRVEGFGYAEISTVDLDFSPSASKTGRKQCFVLSDEVSDFYRFTEQSI